MKKQLILGFVALGATAFAASNTFKVHIFKDSVIEGKTLKAGDYKLSIENGNAVIKMGGESIAVPAREETQPNKAASTELLYVGDTNLQAISVGGTRTRIVFDGAASAHPGI
jgi:hypothetical protein